MGLSLLEALQAFSLRRYRGAPPLDKLRANGGSEAYPLCSSM